MMLQFTSATESDIPIIFEQAKNLIDTYEDTSAIDYEKVIAWVNRKITESVTQYQCVMLEGLKCAYYHLHDDGELDDLYVLPEFRNRGIGTKILKKCIDISEKPLYLYVFSRNTRAIALYERFGFTFRASVGDTRMILERKG